MIAASFDVLFRRLLTAVERYHAVERSPETVDVLARAHWELHLARRAVAEERERLETVGAVYTPADHRWLGGIGIDS